MKGRQSGGVYITDSSGPPSLNRRDDRLDIVRAWLDERFGRDHTRRFAGVAAAVAKLSARALVLDGEVAIYDQQLRSCFDWLREPDADAVATPPMFMAFDLLHHSGRELTGRPWAIGASARERHRGQRPGPAGAATRAKRLRGMDGSDRARLRGPSRQGRSEPVRGGADAAVVEG